MCVCVCVCEREREREKERCGGERGTSVIIGVHGSQILVSLVF